MMDSEGSYDYLNLKTGTPAPGSDSVNTYKNYVGTDNTFNLSKN